MQALLARIPALRTQLHEATVRLNASLTEAETAIKELNLGVQAEVEMTRRKTAKSDWIQLLIFGKESGQWRLIVESGVEGGEFDMTPLVNCSRGVRMRAVEYLPSLLQALADSCDLETAKVDACKKAVDSFSKFLAAQPG